MPTPFSDQLRAAAAADTGLAALLGSNPFRWYDNQLVQGSAFPAVFVQQVSGNRTYVFNGRLATGWNRYQFTIWGGQFAAGVASRNAVESALATFLDQFNAIGISGLALYPNLIVGARESVFPRTDGPIYMKLVDVMIFANDSL